MYELISAGENVKTAYWERNKNYKIYEQIQSIIDLAFTHLLMDKVPYKVLAFTAHGYIIKHLKMKKKNFLRIITPLFFSVFYLMYEYVCLISIHSSLILTIETFYHFGWNDEDIGIFDISFKITFSLLEYRPDFCLHQLSYKNP